MGGGALVGSLAILVVGVEKKVCRATSGQFSILVVVDIHADYADAIRGSLIEMKRCF